jgi:hypothetical protein
MKTTPETALKQAARQFLALHRITTWPYPGALGGVRGFPDRFGITREGKFFAIEFKANGRKLTDNQERVRRQIEQAGGLYIVCRRLEDLAEGLGIKTLWTS